jgi:hypothetical protein
MSAKGFSQRLTATVIGFVILASPVVAQNQPALATEMATVQSEIQKALEDDQNYSGGLVKSLIALRIATLRQTLALLTQRAKAGATRTTLQFVVNGKAFAPPPDAPQQLAAVEQELADNAVKLARQEAEADKYSGGLIRATALATVATMRQTQAMLEQKRIALKYGLPQFVGFKDIYSPATTAAATQLPKQPSEASLQPSGARATELPADCMKVVFGSFCLGGAASSLPANPAEKAEDMRMYRLPEPTLARLVDGRIAGVARFYAPGTWLTYRKVESDITEKYGAGQDLSFFPSYANDSSSQETAISLKKGVAGKSWKQQGYTIQLKWEDSQHVILMYFHDELEAKRSAKKKSEY